MSDAVNVPDAIEEARRLSVQSRATQPPQYRFGILPWSAGSNFMIAPWWSERRDADLRRFWKDSDHLSGALYNVVSKMDAIPFVVSPDDPNDSKKVYAANKFFQNLMYAAEYGEGWHAFYEKFLQDLLSTDNGAFAEIIGYGDPAGPIEGMPITIAHLDSGRCQRTSNAEYPVLYRDRDGTLSKLHWTRVMYASQMTSPIEEMNGVGFCAVSRVVNISQTLIDIVVHKQEKLGSRPHRQLLVTQGGIDPDDLVQAFTMAEIEMDAMGLSRYSKTVVVGDQSIPEGDVKKVELSALPEGYDDEKSTIMGMAVIALGFGVDARELFPAMGAGATRADALLQHIKQRGKGPGQIIQTMESAINFKYLPDYLKMEFEMQDDAEDRQRADIAQVRSMRRERDMVSKVTSIRTEHQRMLKEGEINKTQYIDLELSDGRLEDGSSVLSLFYSTKEPFVNLLAMSVDDPTNISDPTVTKNDISLARTKIYEYQANNTGSKEGLHARMCLAALDELEKTVDKAMFNKPAENQGGDLPRGMLGDRFQQSDPLDKRPDEAMRTDQEPDPAIEQKDAFEAAYQKFDNLLGIEWDD